MTSGSYDCVTSVDRADFDQPVWPLSCRSWLVGLTVLLTAACSSVSPPPALPEGAPSDYPIERFESGRDFTVVSGEITLKVYRSGRLAKLGHNHVITSDALEGWIHFGDSLYAELYLPVAVLVVDDLQARAAAGEGFESVPNERDIQGTRRNMLSAKLLAAQEHPFLRISVSAVDDDTAQADFTVAGQQSSKNVPVTVSVEGDELSASATFQLSHEELGLTPFSALGGAITVSDEIDVEVSLVGRR